MGIVGHHREIARICLTALRERKIRGRFGLGGGNALLLHGTPCARATQDIDVFVGDLATFREAAAAIEASLADHGYTLESVDQFGGLGGAWPEIDDEETGLAEWEVTTPDGQSTIQLQAGFFDLLGEPVTIDGIPVVGLDDIAGHKTAALANRQAARDYIDVAALQEKGYTRERLIALAVERDPGLADDGYFEEAMRHLDQLPDRRLALVMRGSGRDPLWVRAHFTDWPREPV
ncbi:MAG TPA: nucleotidyl transferase AbiEii/AbiGii toxin family protein [Trebonia sp.]|jgi:hypothetical protein